ncbi:hypothetical protein [Mycobacterium shigaense]|nr:hypothetical protein [Mycobacterium shigaense]MEA1124067.1 hypothetical protein [Mycobacterium shigaense]
MSVLEALRQESTDDVVRTELVGYVRDPSGAGKPERLWQHSESASTR